MLTDARTDGRTDDGQKVITIAHPEHSSCELIKHSHNGIISTVLLFFYFIIIIIINIIIIIIIIIIAEIQHVSVCKKVLIVTVVKYV